MDKKPEWAEQEIGKVIEQILKLQEQGKEISAELKQRIDLGFRNHLINFNEILDNRDFNPAPAIVAIIPVSGTKWNPKNWFENEYQLTPYCEFENGVHPIEGVCPPFSMPKEWWQKTAPTLAVGFEILATGIKIACAGLPLAIEPELFKTMKNEVAFMKELASHLGSGESIELLESPGQGQHDFRQNDKDDMNRIARMQLAKLFQEIAPKNYESRQWGELRRLPMSDNTYRWLCKAHAKSLGK